jgi:hypothetical protein
VRLIDQGRLACDRTEQTPIRDRGYQTQIEFPLQITS